AVPAKKTAPLGLSRKENGSAWSVCKENGFAWSRTHQAGAFSLQNHPALTNSPRFLCGEAPSAPTRRVFFAARTARGPETQPNMLLAPDPAGKLRRRARSRFAKGRPSRSRELMQRSPCSIKRCLNIAAELRIFNSRHIVCYPNKMLDSK
ncbi:hypothetical protein, partial [Paratractidigestivibacter sp.]|uniref:hypothetical protein n=1 Tax=Paratractidigestivibacter sp. TaxID=2847316 RepID=UPI002AC9B98A